MSDYVCPECRGEFLGEALKVVEETWYCPWCGQALDGSYEADSVPQEQLETALRFLEWCHGTELSNDYSGCARAYYHAVDVLTDAMEGELKPVGEIRETGREKELVEASREARAEGYLEATQLGQKTTVESTSPSLSKRIQRVFR